MMQKFLTHQKSIHILQESSVILFYHYNSVSMNYWQDLKKELKKIKGGNTLIIQNKVFLNLLKQETNLLQKIIQFDSNTLSNLCQGPTLLVSINSKENFVNIYNLMKNFPNFICVGGLYQNQPFSHIDVEKFVSLPLSIKGEFIQFLKLQCLLFLSYPKQIQHNFSSLIGILSNIKKKESTIMPIKD